MEFQRALPPGPAASPEAVYTGLALGDRAGVSGPIVHQPARGGHGEHAVRDDVGQADGPRDPLVPVDDVEVAARAGVADEVEAGQRKGARRQGVPHRDGVERRTTHH